MRNMWQTLRDTKAQAVVHSIAVLRAPATECWSRRATGLERRDEQECTKMRPTYKYGSNAQVICDPFESPASLKHSGNIHPSE
jgi:hypothetical protein